MVCVVVEDEVNALYVAVTRAQQALLLNADLSRWLTRMPAATVTAHLRDEQWLRQAAVGGAALAAEEDDEEEEAGVAGGAEEAPATADVAGDSSGSACPVLLLLLLLAQRLPLLSMLSLCHPAPPTALPACVLQNLNFVCPLCATLFHPEAEASIDLRCKGQPLCRRCGSRTMYRQLLECRLSRPAPAAAQAGPAIA